MGLSFGFRCVVCKPSVISSNDGAKKFISMEFVVSQNLLHDLYSDSTCVSLLAILVLISRQFQISEGFCDVFFVAEIWRFVGTSQKVHTKSICDLHRTHFFHKFVNHSSSAFLIIMHRRTTVLKFVTPAEHIRTINAFITI